MAAAERIRNRSPETKALALETFKNSARSLHWIPADRRKEYSKLRTMFGTEKAQEMMRELLAKGE